MSWCLGLGAGGWLMLASSLVVLAVAVWAVGRLFPAAPAPEPRTVLDGRLAAGEVDLETYRVLRTEMAGLDPARKDDDR